MTKPGPLPSVTVGKTDAPIFVIGTGRSGTTLLRLMLCAHPRIYIAHEASFYVWQANRGRRARLEDLLEYYFKTHSFLWLRLDPARVLRRLGDPARATPGDAFAAVLREKAADYGRPRFGDKTPAHTTHLRQLFADFPDARVVRIVRDPLNTVQSLSRMPWASASLYANAAACEIERRHVEPFRDRVLAIRLEDLLAAPRDTMGRVLDFVGEPWDDAVLDHARRAPDKNDMPPFPWLEGATTDRQAPEKKGLSLEPAKIRMIEYATRHTMREFGYEPAKLEKDPSWWSVVWAGLRDVPEALRFLGVYWRLARLMRNAESLNSPAAADLFRQVNPGSWARYPGFQMPVPPRLPPPREDESGSAEDGGFEPAGS
jgi:hypothetical protein